MAPRIIVKIKTDSLSKSPILIIKDDVTSLYDVSTIVEKETRIPTSLHLYYDEGETLVSNETFVNKINSEEINLWLYVKGSSSEFVKNVCTKLGIQQNFTVYFKNPTRDRQFENIKFDLSLSSTALDLKRTIKAKHKWLKVSYQTLVYEMNGKYLKVQDGDCLMDFHLRSNLIHEIEYYCFVNKEKHCQNTHLNFLRLPEILLLCKQTGFKCFFPKEDMIFTLDDLKMKIKQEYGVPKHLQILRKYMYNMPENKGVKQIEKSTVRISNT